MSIDSGPIKAFLVALLLSLPLSAQAGLSIQHWQTQQGAQVYFVESHELPMLDIAVDFPAGSARDPAGKAGLAQLTHVLLDMGAGGLSETAIAYGVADVGAELSGRLDRDRAGVTLRTLSSTDEKNRALDVFARVLQQPDFPDDVLKREKQRLISTIREAEADPGTVAEKALSQATRRTLNAFTSAWLKRIAPSSQKAARGDRPSVAASSRSRARYAVSVSCARRR